MCIPVHYCPGCKYPSNFSKAVVSFRRVLQFYWWAMFGPGLVLLAADRDVYMTILTTGCKDDHLYLNHDHILIMSKPYACVTLRRIVPQYPFNTRRPPVVLCLVGPGDAGAVTLTDTTGGPTLLSCQLQVQRQLPTGFLALGFKHLATDLCNPWPANGP